jgi:hypothetical protein
VLSSLSVANRPPNFVPGVLLKAKREAVAQTTDKTLNKGHTQGPWDQGHWANRR